MWSCYVTFILIFISTWNKVIVSSSEDDNSKSFLTIFKDHEGLNAMKWKNYIYTYDEEFSFLRRKFVEKRLGIKLLELGVQNGGSLQIWREYFGDSASITGVDINPDVCVLLGPRLLQQNNIQTHCFDATNETKIAENLSGTFDVTIDDASHRSKDVIDTFMVLFKKLNPGGVYVIEDVATSYDEDYGGGLWHEESTVEFFKLMVELVNAYYIPPKNQNSFELKFFRKLGQDNILYLVRWLKSITFDEQLIFIKKARSGKEPSKMVWVGDEGLVNKNIVFPKYYQNTKEL